MKAQFENSQDEVMTGTQGVTSDQKGPKRARKGQKAVFAPYYRWRYKVRANLPGPDKTEPAGSETPPHDFQNHEDSTFCGENVRFAIRKSLRGLREPFLKIGART
jgi:hypothetical protein